MSAVKTLVMVMMVALGTTRLLAQDYGENQGVNYKGHAQSGNNCQSGQLNQRKPFRPIRNLVQGIRRLGLGKKWISMGSVPRESKQRKIGKAVAKFYANGSVCTATMITPTHAMLNRHCVGGWSRINGSLTFNFEDGISSGNRKRYRCNKVIMTDRRLDLAIVECSGRPGDTWGVAELERSIPPRGTKSFTIHHPGGTSKKYSEGTFGKYRDLQELM